VVLRLLPAATPILLDFDKNRHQICVEMLTKMFAKILGAQNSPLDTRKRLKDGLAMVGWAHRGHVVAGT
jgi:hypothetical protein